MADLSFDDLIPKQPGGSSETLSFSDLVPSSQPREERPRGGYRKQVQAAFEQPAEIVAPSFEEVAGKWGDIAKGVGAGLPSGVIGLFGDIEALARLPGRPFGVSQETRLPTSEQVGTFLFGEPGTEREKFSRVAGSAIGPAALLKGLRIGTSALVGRPTATTEALARQAEGLGFKLEPGQLRMVEPKATPGFAGNAVKNQKLANELVSAETGTKVSEITPKFVGDTLKDLGKKYDDIFSRPIRADRTLENELTAIVDFERRVNPAAVRPAATAADNIVERFRVAREEIGPTVTAVNVDGREIQRLRSELSKIARTASDGNDRRIAGQFVESIDRVIERNNPALAAQLQTTNRQYATAKTLEEMIDKGYVRQGNVSLEKLGDYLANNTYGFGSGTSRHPLYNLGYMGRELNLRALWEGATGKTEDVLKQFLGKAGRYISGGLGLRTQAARRVQSGEPVLPGGAGRAAPVPAIVAPKEGEQ